MKVRPAAVAGLFYPRDTPSLRAELSRYLAATASPQGPPPKAIIAPHAGYVYSGAIAASAYSSVSALRGKVKRVVLAGPAHRVYVSGVAVPSVGTFDSPLGPVHIDIDTVARLGSLPFVEVSDAAHAREHSLEVHLPFLQCVLGDFALVPIVVGDVRVEQMAQLLELVWGGDETLIVVSSDLSHYLPYEAARARDRATVQAILALEAQVHPEEACGAAPINGLLEVARRRGMTVDLLDLRNSGDTAGDRDGVVGYAALAFSEP